MHVLKFQKMRTWCAYEGKYMQHVLIFDNEDNNAVLYNLSLRN